MLLVYDRIVLWFTLMVYDRIVLSDFGIQCKAIAFKILIFHESYTDKI